MRTITATEARVHFGEVLRKANECNEPIFIEKAGKHVAVLLSPPEYQRLKSGVEQDWMERVRKAQQLFENPHRPGFEADAAEMIRADRDERDAQLDEDLR